MIFVIENETRNRADYHLRIRRSPVTLLHTGTLHPTFIANLSFLSFCDTQHIHRFIVLVPSNCDNRKLGLVVPTTIGITILTFAVARLPFNEDIIASTIVDDWGPMLQDSSAPSQPSIRVLKTGAGRLP
ncbi:hypothetical protein ABKN59_001650 [Abortiporus biennis]